MKDKLNLSTAALALSIIGGILVACKLLIVGLVLAVIGLVLSIVGFVRRGEMSINVYLAYWCMIACITILFLSGLGATGYTVYDMIMGHDVN